jgi:hypothetical protein
VRFVSFCSGLLLFLALNVCHISRRPVVSCVAFHLLLLKK